MYYFFSLFKLEKLEIDSSDQACSNECVGTRLVGTISFNMEPTKPAEVDYLSYVHSLEEYIPFLMFYNIYIDFILVPF